MINTTPQACPGCSVPVPVPTPSLCPQCQYPLLLSEPDQRHAGVAQDLHRPSAPEVEDRTRLVPRVEVPPPTAPPPQVPMINCRTCGWPNVESRARCERCGQLLQPEPASAPPPPPPPPPPRARVPWWLVVAPIVLVALMIGLVVWVLLGPQWGTPPIAGPSVSQSETPSEPAPTTLTEIDPETISVTASSVLPPDPEPYDPERTLDGDPRTAWNSDGEKLGADGRPSLTYTFAQPVRIGRIDLWNGFQKNDGLFQRNCRVKTLTVTVGAVSHSFTVADQKKVQALVYDFGAPSTTVVLTIDDVHPGSKYLDIAISEIAFHGLS